MLNKKQGEIIRCISTILFQEYNTRTKEGLKYWSRDVLGLSNESHRGVSSIGEDLEHVFYTTQLNDQWFIGIDAISHDEFGEVEDLKTLGFIRVDPERACWDISGYVRIAESFIEHEFPG